MFSGSGLRLRMAASYVAVSAVAVVVVELVLLALVAPLMRTASDTVQEANLRADRSAVAAHVAKGQATAVESAARLSQSVSEWAAAHPGAGDAELLDVATKRFEQAAVATPADRSDVTVSTALAALDGRVVAAAGDGVPSVGSVLAGAPSQSLEQVWASSAVTLPVAARPGAVRRIGTLALRLRWTGLDAAGDPASAVKPPGALATADPIGGMLLPGLIVLGLLVPVGLVFGLLSTRPLIRRIQRLADGTATMAGGDLRARIPVSGADEVGRLEEAFNAMAERLDAAVQGERDAAGSHARRAERTRIARELHDSVSQQLFSLNLLAGGLRRALPAGSELRYQAESMERTVERTMREMRAMLLELRPVDLEDAGLAAAVQELCHAYEARLGIRISAHVEELGAAPVVEHAVLRVVQEALGNAARHGAADAVELSVRAVEGVVVVAVRDDGRGFDPARAGERHGMGLDLMRERVTELGGTLDVTSALARGTTLEARIPAGVR